MILLFGKDCIKNGLKYKLSSSFLFINNGSSSKSLNYHNNLLNHHNSFCTLNGYTINNNILNSVDSLLKINNNNNNNNIDSSSNRNVNKNKNKGNDQRKYPFHPYIIRIAADDDADFSKNNDKREYPDINDSALYRRRHILLETEKGLQRDVTPDQMAFIYLYELKRHSEKGLTFNTDYLRKLKNIRKLDIKTVESIVNCLIDIKCFDTKVMEVLMSYYMELENGGGGLDKALQLWYRIRSNIDVKFHSVYIRILAVGLHATGDTHILNSLIKESNLDSDMIHRINIVLPTTTFSTTTTTTHTLLSSTTTTIIEDTNIQLAHFNQLLLSSIKRKDYSDALYIFESNINGSLKPNDITYRHIIRILIDDRRNDDVIVDSKDKDKLVAYLDGILECEQVLPRFSSFRRKELTSLLEYYAQTNNSNLLETLINVYEQRFEERALLRHYQKLVELLVLDVSRFTALVDRLLALKYFNIEILNCCLKHVALANDLAVFNHIYRLLPSLYLSPNDSTHILVAKYYALEGHHSQLTDYLMNVNMMTQVALILQQIHLVDTNNINDRLKFYNDRYQIPNNVQMLAQWNNFVDHLYSDTTTTTEEKQSKLKTYIKSLSLKNK
ncbi:hypothetical protein PPL_10391 [Heterostelium album PN500]|uniref:Uncharacterized protein n=1 Tax=Heterostelium pallidum (strain ATCC 26659 / Pp 5 / PN500) TaxID=670386 RepID=D3BQY8_HETP5|nr:hypothetical protein PPL_10391 [Heterostelium album PN500]EFA76174.1 hypothetical protein PPL_10391 [Heterostelium album PN500]|eukprot:XP_020428307.1 hypothetical protein PPL_10391 [Heterostelium album PN500]